MAGFQQPLFAKRATVGLSKKSSFPGGNGYEDVFGGPPKFAGRIDDYAEIFGNFYAHRAPPSIPVLEFPDDGTDELYVDVRGPNFDYSEVFGGVSAAEDFAVSLDEMFAHKKSSRESRKLTRKSSQKAPSVSCKVSPKGQEIDSHPRLGKKGSLSDVTLGYDSALQSDIAYKKKIHIGKDDSVIGTTNIAEFDEVSGFTCVDGVCCPTEIARCYKHAPQGNSDINANLNLNEEIKEGNDSKAFEKKIECDGSAVAADHYLNNLSQPIVDGEKSDSRKIFLTVSEINLRTQPSQLPPPSRLPPKLVEQDDSWNAVGATTKRFLDKAQTMGSQAKGQSHYFRTISENRANRSTTEDTTLPCFDAEVDASSAAAASAAAMKEAMEKAEARIKSAKQLMERKKDNFRSRKLGPNENAKSKEKKEAEISQDGKMEEIYHEVFGSENGGNDLFTVDKNLKNLSTVITPDEGYIEIATEAIKKWNWKESGVTLEPQNQTEKTDDWKSGQFFETTDYHFEGTQVQTETVDHRLDENNSFGARIAIKKDMSKKKGGFDLEKVNRKFQVVSGNMCVSKDEGPEAGCEQGEILANEQNRNDEKLKKSKEGNQLKHNDGKLKAGETVYKEDGIQNKRVQENCNHYGSESSFKAVHGTLENKADEMKCNDYDGQSCQDGEEEGLKGEDLLVESERKIFAELELSEMKPNDYEGCNSQDVGEDNEGLKAEDLHEGIERIKFSGVAHEWVENHKLTMTIHEAYEQEDKEKRMKPLPQSCEQEECERRQNSVEATTEWEENENKQRAVLEAHKWQENEKKLRAAVDAPKQEENEVKMKQRVALDSITREEIEKKLGQAPEGLEQEEKGKKLGMAVKVLKQEEKGKRLRNAVEVLEQEEDMKKPKAAEEALDPEENMEKQKTAPEAQEETEKKLQSGQEVLKENGKKLKAAQEAKGHDTEEKLRAAQEDWKQKENEKKLKISQGGLKQDENMQELKEWKQNEMESKPAQGFLEQEENAKKVNSALQENEGKMKLAQEANTLEENEKLNATQELHHFYDKKFRADKEHLYELKNNFANDACEKESHNHGLEDHAVECEDLPVRPFECEDAAKLHTIQVVEDVEHYGKRQYEHKMSEEEIEAAPGTFLHKENEKKIAALEVGCKEDLQAVNEAHELVETEKQLKDANLKPRSEAQNSIINEQNKTKPLVAQVTLTQNEAERTEASEQAVKQVKESEKKMKKNEEAFSEDDKKEISAVPNDAHVYECRETNKDTCQISSEPVVVKQKNERGENDTSRSESNVAIGWEDNKSQSKTAQAVFQWLENVRKLKAAQQAFVTEDSVRRTAQEVLSNQFYQNEKKTTKSSKVEDEERDMIERESEEMEQIRKLEEEREREKEREKDRIAVERATRDARERAFVERAAVEARQRAMAEAREKAERASAEARERSLAEKASIEARLRLERAAVERATAEARERAAEKAALEARERADRSGIKSNGGLRQSSSFSDACDSKLSAEGESAKRCKARLERHQRTVERAAKALAEKNMRDVLAQREQAERNRLSETLDADVRRWSNGKEGNLRALLSTLQFILGHDSGWQPIPLTGVVTAPAVKKAYRKATLFVHPDKLQQRGASIQQKYICEKVFDLLKEAWNRFNCQEL